MEEHFGNVVVLTCFKEKLAVFFNWNFAAFIGKCFVDVLGADKYLSGIVGDVVGWGKVGFDWLVHGVDGAVPYASL